MQLCSSKNQRKDSGSYSLTKPKTDRRFTVDKQFKDKKKNFRSKSQPKTSRKATLHINTDLSEQGNRFNNTEIYQHWPVKSSIFPEQNAISKWQTKHFFFVEQKWAKEVKAIVSPDREHTPTDPQQKNKQAKTKTEASSIKAFLTRRAEKEMKRSGADGTWCPCERKRKDREMASASQRQNPQAQTTRATKHKLCTNAKRHNTTL
jgi:hypothetical protein